MAVSKSRVINGLAALLVPFGLVAILIVLEKRFYSAVPWYGNSSPIWIGAVVGFLFLVREFRIYSLAMALVYFPAMYYLLLGFGLVFVGTVYGDFI